MSENETPRFGLPLLFAGQTQKELTHNEAIYAIDCLLHTVVEAKLDAPPAALTQGDAGLAWRIGGSPTGSWLSHANQIASWNGGGWRYIVPEPGMRVFDRQLAVHIVFGTSGWVEPVPVANPTQGLVIDGEARAAIAAILLFLRQTAAIPA